MNMKNFRDGRGAARGGFVLVSVLWILAILTVVSLGFARRAMLERQMAWYALDREQAQHMARGAVERALLELRNKALLDEFNNQPGYTGPDQRWAFSVDLFRESGYFQETAGGDFAEDICTYTIEDCERRISLNHAPANYLEGLEALRFGTVEEILERRVSQKAQYRPRRFHSVDELRGIQDFSPDEWYGRRGEAGLRDLLTVWGDYGGRVNVNTASAEVLKAIPDIEGRLVDTIVEYRAGDDGVLDTRDDRSFTTIDDLSRKLGVSAEKMTPLRTFCKTDSRYFIIKARATRRRGKINAFCNVVVELRGGRPAILEWKEQAVGS